MFEKNIAYAYYNRGQFGEALPYFDKVLAFYGVKPNRVSIWSIFRLFYRFLYLLVALYTPFIRGRKSPSKQDGEIIRLIYDRDECLAMLDVKRLFFEFIITTNLFVPFDLSNVKKGPERFWNLSALFSYGGISFKLSKKILTLAQGEVAKDDPYSALVYELCAVTHDVFSGDWEFAHEYDEDLVNQNLKNMGIFVFSYLVLHFTNIMYHGFYAGAMELVEKMDEVGRIYEHEQTLGQKHRLNSWLLLKWGKIREALMEAEKGVEFLLKTGDDVFLFSQYSIKAMTLVKGGDIEGAERDLILAGRIEKNKGRMPPTFQCGHLLAHFMLNLHRLEQAGNSDSLENVTDIKAAAQKAAKKAVGISEKADFQKTETYKLMGVYYWLTDKQSKALKWWRKSIFEGERQEYPS